MRKLIILIILFLCSCLEREIPKVTIAGQVNNENMLIIKSKTLQRIAIKKSSKDFKCIVKIIEIGFEREYKSIDLNLQYRDSVSGDSYRIDDLPYNENKKSWTYKITVDTEEEQLFYITSGEKMKSNFGGNFYTDKIETIITIEERPNGQGANP